MIITIDGPAGSGKSTAARKLAARLQIPYLDTGAMYRVVTLAALEADIDLTDEQALARLADSDHYAIDCKPTHARVTLDGRDVSEEIRSMLVAENTRYIAGSGAVREVLVRRQRRIGRELGSMVTEGRDQGSVAFPDADVKFFLTADLEKRAERRFHEMLAEGEEVTFNAVLDNLRERDRTDAERRVAPLQRPADAIDIDTTHLSIQDVVETTLEHIRGAGLGDHIPPAHGGGHAETRGSTAS